MTIEIVTLVAFMLAMLLWVVHVELIRRECLRELTRQQEAWMAERQQLLDRIQAPSFESLKQAEIKVIKAQQGRETEPPKIVPL